MHEKDITACCCEYYDSEQQKNHLLACCCNCEEFDDACDRYIKCERVPRSKMLLVINKIQDRIRIPWIGGARRLSCDVILPFILLPSFNLIASYNEFATVINFILMLLLLFTLHCNLQKSNFFVMWIASSIAYILLVFEFLVVPLLEIRLDENIIFLSCLLGTVYCLYKIRLRSKNLYVSYHISEAAEVNLNIKEDFVPNKMCDKCNVKIGQRTLHCDICQICISKQDYHCKWFDCCIGEHNRQLFIMFLIVAFVAMIFGSNLILTTVCHPFLFYWIILMPDDCSEVYMEYDTAICFVTGAYCIISATFLFIVLLQQIWFISLGITGKEWHSLKSHRIPTCFLYRPYSKGLLNNWKEFLCKK